jgi:phenylacetate-CoA ligase
MSDEGGLQRQFYDMLMDSQWWSAEQLRSYQRSQLSQLLRHAKANVPFYEHRLDAVLKPNGDVDWDRWSEIPIVTRTDMVEHREAMQATELPVGHGPTSVSETSGSTGIAIAITSTQVGELANNGLRWRCQRWNGLDWSKNLCIRDGEDPSVGAFPYGKAAGHWGPFWDERAQRGQAWTINKIASGEEVLRFHASHRCSYLNTGPKTAHTLALDALRLDLDISIDAFLCQGEAVNSDDRDICRDVFGARLIEYYSSKEAGQIGHSCEAGHLHANSECMLVEIVNAQGTPCQRGESGRVIVTPFFSTAQPLIRYEQGDLAVPGSPCACGRSLPVIDAVVGRQFAMFRHPDGRATVQVLPMDARRALHCEHMQIAQVGANNYEVRYVPVAGAPPPEEAEFMTYFHRTFFDDAEVTLLPVAAIRLTPAGKMLEYVNEWVARQ